MGGGLQRESRSEYYKKKSASKFSHTITNKNGKKTSKFNWKMQRFVLRQRQYRPYWAYQKFVGHLQKNLGNYKSICIFLKSTYLKFFLEVRGRGVEAKKNCNKTDDFLVLTPPKKLRIGARKMQSWISIYVL